MAELGEWNSGPFTALLRSWVKIQSRSETHNFLWLPTGPCETNLVSLGLMFSKNRSVLENICISLTWPASLAILEKTPRWRGINVVLSSHLPVKWASILETRGLLLVFANTRGQREVHVATVYSVPVLLLNRRLQYLGLWAWHLSQGLNSL